MKPDLYSKCVLTVIAICLVWLCAKDVVSPNLVAHAQKEPQSVKIIAVELPKNATVPVSIAWPLHTPTLTSGGRGTTGVVVYDANPRK